MCRGRGGGGLVIEYDKLPVDARYISLNSSKVGVHGDVMSAIDVSGVFYDRLHSRGLSMRWCDENAFMDYSGQPCSAVARKFAGLGAGSQRFSRQAADTAASTVSGKATAAAAAQTPAAQATASASGCPRLAQSVFEHVISRQFCPVDEQRHVARHVRLRQSGAKPACCRALAGL